jgi:hypothetical protein
MSFSRTFWLNLAAVRRKPDSIASYWMNVQQPATQWDRGKRHD